MINLRDKSLGTPFNNLTYFPFACGDEIPLKFVKSLIFYDQDCLRKRFFLDLRRKKRTFDQNNVGRNQEKRVFKRF